MGTIPYGQMKENGQGCHPIMSLSVLMRSLKTSGGLTRGHGMSEQQKAIWTLSMPACASVNSSIQELTGVQRATGEMVIKAAL